MPLYKKELTIKVLELHSALRNEKVELFFNDESFRDYMLIAEVSKNGQNYGKLLIYYKPSKNTYSIKKQIKNEKISVIIDNAWNNLNGNSTYDARSGIYEAFVDGSYIAGAAGYGAVIYLGDELKAEITGIILNVEFRQFGGELQSVIEVLKWCFANKVLKVRINYDYQGIEKFATGEWKPKNNLSKEYVSFIKNANINIEWRHIKSHTGNKKNDEADVLAKKAAMSVSSTVSKKFVNLKNKALNFINFINHTSKFYAQYVVSENCEINKIKIKNKETKHSSIIEIIYAKTGSFSIRQPKNPAETEICALWQEFLLTEDFRGM
ncbi:MAG: reverse transcriptase-like protein [Endomicrobium sp.]|jgi:ribonuclease HI|nr:reverse transcriptase-like protein [Endomicrobium sp.]